MTYLLEDFQSDKPLTVVPKEQFQVSLPPGAYDFELIVTDDEGKQSEPVPVRVRVDKKSSPKPAITKFDEPYVVRGENAQQRTFTGQNLSTLHTIKFYLDDIEVKEIEAELVTKTDTEVTFIVKAPAKTALDKVYSLDLQSESASARWAGDFFVLAEPVISEIEPESIEREFAPGQFDQTIDMLVKGIHLLENPKLPGNQSIKPELTFGDWKVNLNKVEVTSELVQYTDGLSLSDPYSFHNRLYISFEVRTTDLNRITSPVILSIKTKGGIKAIPVNVKITGPGTGDSKPSTRGGTKTTATGGSKPSTRRGTRTTTRGGSKPSTRGGTKTPPV